MVIICLCGSSQLCRTQLVSVKPSSEGCVTHCNMDFKCVEEHAGIKATLLCIIYTYIRHKVNRFPLFADVVSCFDHNLFLLPLISSKVAATAASNPLLSKLRLSLSEVSRCIKSTQTVFLKAVFLFTFAPHSSP